MNGVLCWHFLPANRRMRTGEVVTTGKTYTIEEEPVLCRRGLHGSRKVIHALAWKKEPVCCRVRIGGKIVEGFDQLAGQTREVLWMYDISHILHLFACKIVDDAILRWGRGNPILRNAMDCKLKWLDNKCSDAALDDAHALVGVEAAKEEEVAYQEIVSAAGLASQRLANVCDSTARAAGHLVSIAIAEAKKSYGDTGMSMDNIQRREIFANAGWEREEFLQNEVLEKMIFEYHRKEEAARRLSV